MPASTFQRCAVASGLVTQDDLEQARQALRAGKSPTRQALTDDDLAIQLIAMGRVNSWQATQLAAGRSTFTLGPYRIVDSLGKGSTGDVYMAEHSLMGRIVAIKVLPRRISSPEAIEKFNTEIRTQGQLDHNHLVRAFDAGHHRNVHFLVMEYVPGTNLRKLARRQGQLSMRRAAALVAQAAEGLAYAHGRGLTHRDVKPSNLLVTPEDQVKLSDLGLAGFFSHAPSANTDGKAAARAADFLAPEQIQQPGTFSPATDLYALGCTLYYAVTGKVPFPGPTLTAKLDGHLHALPRHPRLLNASLSEEFVELVGDLMAKDPRERLADADAVATRLKEVAGQT
ncbi:MAG TPA: serine/threonine-protein kinase [Pirellulales bacterium]|nr:serine/threonine-protein kinase [Pirellulales bacterium]